MSDTNEITQGCLIHYDNQHLQVRKDFLSICSYKRADFEERRKEEPDQECMAKILRLLETLTDHYKVEWRMKAKNASDKGLKTPEEPKEYPIELTYGAISSLLSMQEPDYTAYGESTIRNCIAYLLHLKYIRRIQERKNSIPIYWLQIDYVQEYLKQKAEARLSGVEINSQTNQSGQVLKSTAKRLKSTASAVKSTPERPKSAPPAVEINTNNIGNSNNITEKDKIGGTVASADAALDVVISGHNPLADHNAISCALWRAGNGKTCQDFQDAIDELHALPEPEYTPDEEDNEPHPSPVTLESVKTGIKRTSDPKLKAIILSVEKPLGPDETVQRRSNPVDDLYREILSVTQVEPQEGDTPDALPQPACSAAAVECPVFIADGGGTHAVAGVTPEQGDDADVDAAVGHLPRRMRGDCDVAATGPGMGATEHAIVLARNASSHTDAQTDTLPTRAIEQEMIGIGEYDGQSAIVVDGTAGIATGSEIQPAVTRSRSGEKPVKPAKTSRPPKEIPQKPALTAEGRMIYDAWCSLFHVAVPEHPTIITAANVLALPVGKWATVLDKPIADVLKDIKDWLYENDKKHYYNGRGVKLYDISREFEGWQSEQERQLVVIQGGGKAPPVHTGYHNKSEELRRDREKYAMGGR